MARRPDTSHARYTNQRFLTFLSKVRTGFVQDRYHEKPDAVLACGLSVEALVAPGTEVIRLAPRPWEQWLYPEFVKTAQDRGLAGYDRMRPKDKRFDADTGELSLDYGRGLMTINTPRSQAAIGYLGAAGSQALGQVAIDCQNEFAAVIVTSLDRQPIGESRRMLVTAVGRAENTSQGYLPPTPEQLTWTPTAWMLPGEGRPPVIVEPIRAEVLVATPGPAKAYVLDVTGKRGATMDCTHQDGRVRLGLEGARSIWCELVVP